MNKVFGIAGITGWILFIIKVLIDYFKKKKLEKLKILYQERAKVIAELYKYLSQMERAHSIFSGAQYISEHNVGETVKLLKSNAYESYRKFTEFADDNMVWFPEKIENQINELNLVLKNIWGDIEFLKISSHIPDNDEAKIQARNAIKDNIKKMKDLKANIKNEFRLIIR